MYMVTGNAFDIDHIDHRAFVDLQETLIRKCIRTIGELAIKSGDWFHGITSKHIQLPQIALDINNIVAWNLECFTMLFIG